MSLLDLSLRLHVVLKGAVDPRQQIRHVTSLEDQLARKKEGYIRHKINGRTWCTWIVIRYDMRVNGCGDGRWVGVGGVKHGYERM